MTNIQKQLFNSFLHQFKQTIEPKLISIGFIKKSDFNYEIKLAESFIRLNLGFQFNPKEDQASLAVIYPWIIIDIYSINNIISRFKAKNESPYPYSENTISQPIEIMSSKITSGIWYFRNPIQIEIIVNSIFEFFNNYLFEFTNNCHKTSDFIDFYIKHPDKFLTSEDIFTKVVIGLYLIKGEKKVDEFIAQRFKRTAQIKRIQKFLEFLNTEVDKI